MQSFTGPYSSIFFYYNYYLFVLCLLFNSMIQYPAKKSFALISNLVYERRRGNGDMYNACLS